MHSFHKMHFSETAPALRELGQGNIYLIFAALFTYNFIFSTIRIELLIIKALFGISLVNPNTFSPITFGIMIFSRSFFYCISPLCNPPLVTEIPVIPQLFSPGLVSSLNSFALFLLWQICFTGGKEITHVTEGLNILGISFVNGDK